MSGFIVIAKRHPILSEETVRGRAFPLTGSYYGDRPCRVFASKNEALMAIKEAAIAEIEFSVEPDVIIRDVSEELLNALRRDILGRGDKYWRSATNTALGYLSERAHGGVTLIARARSGALLLSVTRSDGVSPSGFAYEATKRLWDLLKLNARRTARIELAVGGLGGLGSELARRAGDTQNPVGSARNLGDAVRILATHPFVWTHPFQTPDKRTMRP